MEYKTVHLGDERKPITGIMFTDDLGGQQMIVMDVNEGYAEKITAFLNTEGEPGSYMPVPKIRNGAITGAIVLLAITIAEQLGYQVDAELSSLITLVASMVAGYMTPPAG